MVRIEEVEDRDIAGKQDGPFGGEDDWNTDDESETSSLSSTTSSLEHETLLERLTALRDMLPASQRRVLSTTAARTQRWLRAGLGAGGKALWVLSTSLLLLGVPWALAYGEEQQMVEMEREMQQQQAATDLLTGGGEAKAAL